MRCTFRYAGLAALQGLQKRATFLAISGASAKSARRDGCSRTSERQQGVYTGKIDNPNLNAPVETTTNAAGNTIVTSFPNDIDEFPVPVTKELVDRGQDRFNIYCIVCHGPVGNGDGMIVRRGFSQPPTYHDDRLRNAPVGHFFDVITNGWGKMKLLRRQTFGSGSLGGYRLYSGAPGEPESGRNLKNELQCKHKHRRSGRSQHPNANTHGGKR